jgi:hypothetical protein
MHTFEMKKREFIKNKVVEHIVRMNVQRTKLIPLTHVSQPSFETNGYWIIRNQFLVNVEYKIKYLFTKYLGCTCEWALRRNLCKHQNIIIFMVTDVTQEDVVDYYGTWFRSSHIGLVAMFVDPKYIIDDSYFKDDCEANGDKGVIDIGLIRTMEKVVLHTDKVKNFNELESSSFPLEGTLVRLHHTMKEHQFAYITQ